MTRCQGGAALFGWAAFVSFLLEPASWYEWANYAAALYVYGLIAAAIGAHIAMPPTENRPGPEW